MSGCADLGALADRAEQAIVELRVEDARATLDELEAGFACTPADADTLSRFFLVEGALAVHANDAAGAATRFRSARDLDSDGPGPLYGKKVRAAFDAATRAPVDATIALDPPPGDADVRVDARQVTVPLSVTGGLHLVQVGRAGSVGFGEIVLVPPGETLVVTAHARALTPPAPLPSPAPAPAPPPSARKGPKVPLLAASAGMLVVGSVSAGLALRAQNNGIPSASSLDEVDGAWTRQRVFGIGAYGLWGGAAVTAGLSFL